MRTALTWIVGVFLVASCSEKTVPPTDSAQPITAETTNQGPQPVPTIAHENPTNSVPVAKSPLPSEPDKATVDPKETPKSPTRTNEVVAAATPTDRQAESLVAPPTAPSATEEPRPVQPTTTAIPPPTTEAAAKAPSGGDPRFGVWMRPGGKAKAGQQAHVEVVLVPKGEFHCNKDYPYKFKLGAAPAGVTYPESVVRRASMSIGPNQTVARVPFVASRPGDVKISGTLSFSVCTDNQCVIETRSVATVVKVE